MKNKNCEYDKYILTIQLLNLNTEKYKILIYSKRVGQNIFIHLSVHVFFLQFKPYSQHIIKGKLGSNLGHAGILTGNTRVSHTHPLGSYGTP